MPCAFSYFGVLPSKVLRHQVVQSHKNRCDDFNFIKATLSMERLPDYNGFNTCQSRQAGLSLKPKTKIIFDPPIDKTPSYTSTILTACLKQRELPMLLVNP